MNDLECLAYRRATRAHKDQERWAGEPYIVHPIRVALLVALSKNEKHVVAAAYLHDVLEDTEESILDFPERVQEIVALLTKNKGESKIDSINRLQVDPDAVLVKMADRVDNMLDDSRGRYSRKLALESTRCLLMAARSHGLEFTLVYERLCDLYDSCFAECAAKSRKGE